ncbi:MAG: SPASM domain-containing protein [Deltaproteobacteria bacterium]|nr:SPASM domain-containing protein [Deltaproteobacteria bacterium]
MAVVAPDGKMSTCCYAYDQASDVGDVFADGFEAAWNGPRMTAVRRGLTGQAALQHPCAGCGAARRL